MASKSQEQAQQIFTILHAANPHPTTELNYNNGFELLTAVILSAQATDVGVNKATAKLFPIANSAEKIAQLGIEGLIPYIKTIGLYQTKAKNVVAMARILLEKHNAQIEAVILNYSFVSDNHIFWTLLDSNFTLFALNFSSYTS